MPKWCVAPVVPIGGSSGSGIGTGLVIASIKQEILGVSRLSCWPASTSVQKRSRSIKIDKEYFKKLNGLIPNILMFMFSYNK